VSTSGGVAGDGFFRVRPHWYALAFQYGLGLVVAWQLVEDLSVGQGKVFSGEFFPWRQYVDWDRWFGSALYPCLVAIEITLLVLYFLRIRLRWVAAGLAAVLFVDGLGSFLNHRLLMSIEMLLVSFFPVGRDAGDLNGKSVRWNLDLVRWQASIVYVFTAFHKLNAEFLSGRTLSNLFFMTQEQGMHEYPDVLRPWLENPEVCMALAWLTVVTEFALVVGLNSRRMVGWFLPIAFLLHTGMAALMAYIWIFTFQMYFLLIAFLPDRTPDGPCRLVPGTVSPGPTPWLRLCVPGSVLVSTDAATEPRWSIRTPDGERRTGFDAWVTLLSASPLTFGLAEVLRIAPLTWLGRRMVRGSEPQ
jgi:hypothetical protein